MSQILDAETVIIRDCQVQNYNETWQAMRQFVDQRTPETPDEIWLVEHPAVFTVGQNGKMEHVLQPGDIPVLHVDRGGQVTYHGPGQLVAYIMVDLNRLELGVKKLVATIEDAVIALLKCWSITATKQEGAPGIFVGEAKICSIGLRIRKGYSYHGLSLNINMDLEPFTRINPCGYRGLVMTQLSKYIEAITLNEVKPLLIAELVQRFGYHEIVNLTQAI